MNEFNDANFKSEVLDCDQPVMVDFWGEYCPPCKALGPTFEEIASKYAGSIKFGKAKIDDCHKTCVNYSVSSIPTVILFNKGEAVERLVGLRKKSEFESILDKFLPAQKD